MPLAAAAAAAAGVTAEAPGAAAPGAARRGSHCRPRRIVVAGAGAAKGATSRWQKWAEGFVRGVQVWRF